jgi:hypothetical protein
MLLHRKTNDEGECPLNKKLACKDCRLFRRGIILRGKEKRQEEISGCVFHLMCDNLEASHIATRRLQAEMGETKTAAIFQALALLVNSAQAKSELKRLIARNIDGIDRFLGISEKQPTDLENLIGMIDEETEE